MRVAVLGAGVVGVTAAWYLAQDGHEVTVVDRQDAPAQETSFANGGQISASYAEPWANPAAPAKILQWLGREDAPLLFRLRLDPRQWRWGLQFLLECLPSRTRRNTIECLNLALYSRDCLNALREETGIEYDRQARGILTFYTDAGELEQGATAAALMREFGCDRDVKNVAECVAIEPALAACRDRLAGGIYTASDESGDAQRFTTELARMAAARGVAFRWATTVAALLHEGGAITGVRCMSGGTTPTLAPLAAPGGGRPVPRDGPSGRATTPTLAPLAAPGGGRPVPRDGPSGRATTPTLAPLAAPGGGGPIPRDGSVDVIRADAYVVALGSYSPFLLAPLSVPCLVYPAKGYSATIAIDGHHGAPHVSLTDIAAKIVFTRLGDRLRVAGTAELSGYGLELNAVRCEALVKRTFDLFPDAGDRATPRFWTGLRPATPSNVPLVGRTRYPNLFLDTGHGTLGWTMACGSGRALADLVANRTPGVNFAFT